MTDTPPVPGAAGWLHDPALLDPKPLTDDEQAQRRMLRTALEHAELELGMQVQTLRRGSIAESERRAIQLELKWLRARVAELEAENGRLTTLVDAAHGIICNAHQKRVDDVTNEDGASPGWAEAARRWIDAYPFGFLDAVADETPEQEEA